MNTDKHTKYFFSILTLILTLEFSYCNFPVSLSIFLHKVD